MFAFCRSTDRQAVAVAVNLSPQAVLAEVELPANSATQSPPAPGVLHDMLDGRRAAVLAGGEGQAVRAAVALEGFGIAILALRGLEASAPGCYNAAQHG